MGDMLSLEKKDDSDTGKIKPWTPSSHPGQGLLKEQKTVRLPLCLWLETHALHFFGVLFFGFFGRAFFGGFGGFFSCVYFFLWRKSGVAVEPGPVPSPMVLTTRSHAGAARAAAFPPQSWSPSQGEMWLCHTG